MIAALAQARFAQEGGNTKYRSIKVFNVSESGCFQTPSVRRFVRERLLPIENQVIELGRIPEAIILEMRQLSLYGLSFPEC